MTSQMKAKAPDKQMDGKQEQQMGEQQMDGEQELGEQQMGEQQMDGKQEQEQMDGKQEQETTSNKRKKIELELEVLLENRESQRPRWRTWVLEDKLESLLESLRADE